MYKHGFSVQSGIEQWNLVGNLRTAMLLITNLKYNPEQIRVDVYVIPDIAVLADSVIDLMLLPTPHIGCVLEFGVCAKSFISSPC